VRDDDEQGKVVLDVDGLRMRYGTTDVLHDVTFQARHGEVHVLLGPNGAGNSTMVSTTRRSGRMMRSLAPPAWWLAVSMKFPLRRCAA
jgi:ABC-type uncharacterized transport system ATPase subunit